MFAAVTVLVTTSAPLTLDSRAFTIAHDLRAPWLDRLARILTTLGLIAIIGPVLLVGAAFLAKRRHRARATALLVGGALTWIGVWLLKAIVDRSRPSAPLVSTSGRSYPSGHAANAVGWLALAIAVTVLIRSRARRVAAVLAGASIAMLVGLTRIYLRAHYASDVLGGEAFAVGMYALAGVGAYLWRARGVDMRIGRDRETIMVGSQKRSQ
jgi:membrane-associated phospholipid phosphatase